jgi:type I restriction enzyme S subunit
MNAIPVPVPPIAEQRRIVVALEDHLSRVDAGLASLRATSRRIQRFRNQIIAVGCTGSFLGMEGVGAPTPPHVGLHEESMPRIPEHWRWARLHEVADVVGGITKDAGKQNDPVFEEVYYLRVANVQSGRIDLSNVATIKASKAKIEQLALRSGDVLLNEGGDRDKLARGWVWEEQLPLCIHQNHVFRARVRDGVLDPKILAWHANGFGRVWAEVNGKQSVNLASISLSKIRLLPVPIPPKVEQSRIVSMIEENLDAVDRLMIYVSMAENRAKQLRRSLLAEAFAGRLVLQDSNDEPASVLLERIRSQGTAQPKLKRTRQSKQSTPIQEALL